MSHRCYEIEELGRLTQLAADDPQLRHLATCPRCRARLAAYRQFMQPDALPPEAQAERAQARLTAALEEAAVAAPTTRMRRSPFESLITTLRRPALVPAWGLVAVLLLVWIFAGDGLRNGEAPGVLRGEETARGRVILAADADALSDGTLLLTWQPHAACEEYELLILGSDLAELRRIAVGSETEWVFDPAELEEGETFYWRIVGLEDGEPVARSSLKPMDLSHE